jgi:hypothetical protein
MIIGLIFSLSLNVLLIWYVSFLLKKMYFISETTDDLIDSIEGYQEHTESVYSADLYHGDETLQHLIQHTKDLHSGLKEYQKLYDVSGEVIEREKIG